MGSFVRNLGASLGAVALGMVAVILGSIPKDVIFAANLAYLPHLPWLIVPTAIYLWIYWRYLGGAWAPTSTSQARRKLLRANPLPIRVWFCALLAGVTGIVALVMSLRVVNRLVELPPQQFFDVSHLSLATIVAIIVVGAVVAGVVEEASFRGYMQGPIEERFGVVVAILVSGLMFAVAHLGLTAILIPYYITVAALYGVITWLTNSILPAVLLHIGGNIFSSTYLWQTGHAEWQASAVAQPLVWRTGVDQDFCLAAAYAAGSLVVTLAAYLLLAWTSRGRRAMLAP